MMKLKSILFIMIIFVLSLTGCTKELDTKTVQETALSNIKNLNSIQVHLKSDIELNNYKSNIDDLSSKIIYSDDKSYTRGYYVKYNNYEQYLTYQNDIPVVYTKKDNNWSNYINKRNELDSISILLQMLLSSDSQTNFKSMGFIDLNHKKCYRLTRQLDLGTMQFILSDINLIMNNTNDNINFEDINISNINLEVYIDAKTLYPIRYNIKANNIMINIDLDNFNNINLDDISVPSDILNTSLDTSVNTTDIISNTNYKPEQTELKYSVSFDNKFMAFMNKDKYAVTVNDIAHIIEAKTDNKFIRAFLVKDKPASDAAKVGYDFDKSLVLEQDESPEMNVKDSHISDIQTKSLDKYSVYAYSFDYMDIDTGLITQVYNYYIDLGDNIYVNIVLNQTNKNKISDDEAFAVLSDFIFTT